MIAQELIAKECQSYMLKNGSMQEDDLSALADCIRVTLTGRTPMCDFSVPKQHTQRHSASYSRHQASPFAPVACLEMMKVAVLAWPLHCHN